MFQIAGTIGIATKNNHPYCFPEWINYDHKERFGSGEEIEVHKFFENKLPALADLNYQYMWINWGYHDVRLGDGSFDLAGHFQSDKYFAHCIDVVRYYFRMKDEYPANDYVAVHYRSGDYIDDPNAYHPRCSKEYYQQAMSLFPGSTFLLFSDDTDRAIELVSEFGNVEVAKGKDYIDDFKLMKSCKHFITANSSYSLMAAILGEAEDKKIVCPKRWFGPTAGINGDDCYPKNAIVI
jgi:hypothetical protein